MKSGTPRCLHEAKAAPPTPSLVQWKKLFWLPHTAKGNDPFRMFMMTPKSQDTQKHRAALRRCRILGSGSCIPVFSENLCEPISFSAASCWHIVVLALRVLGKASPGHSAWYHAAVSTHMLFGGIKMKNWMAAIYLPFVFSVLLNHNLNSLG